MSDYFKSIRTLYTPQYQNLVVVVAIFWSLACMYDCHLELKMAAIQGSENQKHVICYDLNKD